jgi:hypothetical protein
MSLHTMAYRLMRCGCQPDDEAGFMLVCNMHFHASDLLSACIESSKPLDERIKLAVMRSCGQSEAKTDGK